MPLQATRTVRTNARKQHENAEVRRETLATAIRACLTGDVGLCERVFTADVVRSSPTMAASSRDELETLLSNRADALANVELSIVRLLLNVARQRRPVGLSTHQEVTNLDDPT